MLRRRFAEPQTERLNGEKGNLCPFARVIVVEVQMAWTKLHGFLHAVTSQVYKEWSKNERL